ncbi:MAG: hypothetical protein EA351_02065 [Gemmatimonadales bacterium]|nr:MAG: hypothetical protein EA351_02065 [Gemmatimonadales bacterium]
MGSRWGGRGAGSGPVYGAGAGGPPWHHTHGHWTGGGHAGGDRRNHRIRRRPMASADPRDHRAPGPGRAARPGFAERDGGLAFGSAGCAPTSHTARSGAPRGGRPRARDHPGGERIVRLRLTLRSLLIQAAWNPTDLLGTGLAWGLGGGRATAEGAEPDPTVDVGTRWHFNSHPYLASVAMGALEAMRRAGATSDERDRFRVALRGPLGAMGDALVWAGGLPAALLLGGTVWILGASPVGAVILFLALFNGLHLGLRWWGTGVGLRHGRAVALAFQRANLGGWAERARGAAVVLAGVVTGVLSVVAVQWLDRPLLWIAAGGILVLAGQRKGMALSGLLPAAFALALVVLGFGLTLLFGGS